MRDKTIHITCRLFCHSSFTASEEVAVRTGTGQFEDEDVFVNLVDEKPVGRDVAFAVVHPVADERMVVVLGRKLLAVGKLGDYGLKLLKWIHGFFNGKESENETVNDDRLCDYGRRKCDSACVG